MFKDADAGNKDKRSASERLLLFLKTPGAERYSERGLELQRDYMGELDHKGVVAIAIATAPEVRERFGDEVCEDVFNQGLNLIRDATYTISFLSMLHAHNMSAPGESAVIDVGRMKKLASTQQTITLENYLKLSKLMSTIGFIMSVGQPEG